jgi:hypothetical protein
MVAGDHFPRKNAWLPGQWINKLADFKWDRDKFHESSMKNPYFLLIVIRQANKLRLDAAERDKVKKEGEGAVISRRFTSLKTELTTPAI